MTRFRRQLKAIVIDSNEQSNQSLKKMCEKYFSNNIVIVDTFTSPSKAVKDIYSKETDLDLVFIDSGFSGINVFDFISTKPFGTITKFVVISSGEKHVLQALKHQVFDYLKKPIRLREFKVFMKRVLEYFKNKVEREEDSIRDNILIINRHDKALFLDVCDITRIEANGSYSDIFLEKGNKISSTKNLSFYQELLEDHQFYKVHRSHLINISKVRELVKYDGEGVIIMSDQSKIVISKTKKNEFLKSFSRSSQ